HINTAKQTVKTVEGTGDFAQLVEGLESGCTYVYQALAGNSVGDSAGQYLEFTTPTVPSFVELTVLPATGGQVLAPGAGTYEYESPQSVPITALAGEGYLFLGWSGTAVAAGQVADASAADTTVAMEDNYSLQPVFAEINPVLYVDAQAAANGLQVGTAVGSFVTMEVVELPDGTINNPFVTIQQAIDAALGGETILVLPGFYVESLNFNGKAIHVMSLALVDPNVMAVRAILFPGEELNSLGAIDTTIIHGDSEGPVVVFESGEGADTVLSGFTLTGGLAGSGSAIQCSQSGPTITHCVIAGNATTSLTGGAVNTVQGAATFINCTIADNTSLDVEGAAVVCEDSNDVFINCILWSSHPDQIVVVSGNDPLIEYCNIQGRIWPGTGNTTADPCFALSGEYGDYHLQSAFGRYDPNEMDPNVPVWVLDQVTSPCIDMGDPGSPFDSESIANGYRVNMGAYGDTKDASRSDVQVEVDFVSVSEGGFSGEMSRHEITNGQYCEYLKAALAEGMITVHNDRVYAGSDTEYAAAYFDTFAQSEDSQIAYSSGTFWVRSRDGLSMVNHPVVCVTWYGATAFAEYNGYRLPSQEEWQAVADYDGSYSFGSGISIDPSLVNYHQYNPLKLSAEPYTSPVGYYGDFGYGLYEMSGNVSEWTASISGSSRIAKGGSWASQFRDCTVKVAPEYSPDSANGSIGFRVCR
ncbi:MAG: SUMF1/EgtB/PvdO family nonheme iron enzyme, partial [Phycisphaeraceae bacterium]|nr:SUMF1/EgtB/PvdO family nonheme iron enzyme [Phycisphaeraceae bacterium]